MLSDQEKQDLMGYFEAVSDKQNVDIEEVIKIFEGCLSSVVKMDGSKPRAYLLLRAKGAMDNSFANRVKKGEDFIFIPFGPRPYGSSNGIKDWNSGEYFAIQKVINEGTDEEIEQLVEDGKLMYMIQDEKRIPITEIVEGKDIQKYYFNGEFLDEEVEGSIPIKLFTVIDGTPWDGAGTPLFRDFRRTNTNGNLNYSYTHVLGQRWQFNLTGIGYLESNPEDIRLIDHSINFEQADPESEKFFLNTHEMFKAYKGNFSVDDSCPWKFKLANRGSLVCHSTEITDTIDLYIKEALDNLVEKYSDEAKSVGEFIPSFIYLNQLEEAHNRGVLLDASGAIQKTNSEYDKTNRFAYSVLWSLIKTVTPPASREKSMRYALSDAVVGTRSAFCEKYMREQKFKLPATALLMIRTSRGPYKYDFATRTKTYDPGHGDIKTTVLSASAVMIHDTPDIGLIEGIE